MVVGLAAMFISCNNSDSGDGGSKMIVSVEVYSVDKDGNEVIFLRANELKVNADCSVNDALIALIQERQGTYKALADGSVDSITFDGETLAQKNEGTVSSDENSKTFRFTHFVWTVNGTAPDKATSLTYKIKAVRFVLVEHHQVGTQVFFLRNGVFITEPAESGFTLPDGNQSYT